MTNQLCTDSGHDYIADDWRYICTRQGCTAWVGNYSYNEDYLDRDEEYGGWEDED